MRPSELKPGYTNLGFTQDGKQNYASGLKSWSDEGNIDAAVDSEHMLCSSRMASDICWDWMHMIWKVWVKNISDIIILLSAQASLVWLIFVFTASCPRCVLTIEPGCYFIQELINIWKSEKKFSEFIDYNRIESYMDFGGIRIEDNILITEDGNRILGKPVPKSIEDVEQVCS